MLQNLKKFTAKIKKSVQSPVKKDKIEKALNIPKPIQAIKAEPTKQYEDHACPEYMDLKVSFRNVGRMNAIIETLGRDFLTAMPDGAYISRLGQIAFLYRRMHDDLAEPHLIDLLNQAKNHQQNNKNDEPNQQDEQQNQKQQPPPEISKEEAQRILNALKDNEKDLQKELRQKKGKAIKVEKDW